MKFKKVSLLVCIASLSFTGMVYANEVQFSTNKAMLITYRVVHQKANGAPVFSALKSLQIDKHAAVTVDLDGYDVAGVAPVTVDGHDLPESATHFNQSNQCSMATNANKPIGELEFIIEPKRHTCKTHGGVFG